MRSDPFPVAAVALLILLVAWPVAAAGPSGPGSWCGTRDTLLEEVLAAHRRNLERLRPDLNPFAAAASTLTPLPAVNVTRDGDLALIEDDGTIILPPNPVDLNDLGVRFRRRKKTFKVTRYTGGLGATLGEKLPLRDDDSIRVDFPQGAKFRFFGERYGSVWVNSDGNLTFGDPDSESTARDLGRMLNGPPRISPFFTDLNPETAPADGGVFVRAIGKKLRITWFRLPEFGGPNLNTFQVTLAPRGHITIAWGVLETGEGIVGVAPGLGSGVEQVDITDDPPFKAKDTAVAERFGSSEDVDHAQLAQTFFRHFADDYDHLIVFFNFPIDMQGALAWELTVSNDIRGIGERTFDASAQFGSDGRLHSYVNMGPLFQYPDDPETDIVISFGLNSLQLLGHEAGHRWLALAQVIDESGNPSKILLGRQLAHWAFYFDTDASVMEGNEIIDNGDGTFVTVDRKESYSPLDRYLMGMIPASRVPDFFYVADSGIPAAKAPQPESGLQGRRVDHRIEDVIAALGEREPNAANAQKTIRMAFLIVSRAGQPPSNSTMNRVDRLRREWESYFRRATGRNGRADTTLISR